MRSLSNYESKVRGTPDFPCRIYRVDKNHPDYHMQLHWHADYELIVVREGTLILTANEQAITLGCGDVAFLSDGMLHSCMPVGDTCRYDCIVYAADLMSRNSSRGEIKEIFEHTRNVQVFLPESVYPRISAAACRLCDAFPASDTPTDGVSAPATVTAIDTSPAAPSAGADDLAFLQAAFNDADDEDADDEDITDEDITDEDLLDDGLDDEDTEEEETSTDEDFMVRYAVRTPEQRGDELILIGKFYELFGEIIKSGAASLGPRGSNRHIKRLKVLISYIEAHFNEHITLAELADLVDVSPKYLCRNFYALTGRTPIAYIGEYRVEVAMTLLREGDKSLSEIAVMCGFGDQSYFVKQFKRRTGTTPGHYRRAWRHAEKAAKAGQNLPSNKILP